MGSTIVAHRFCLKYMARRLKIKRPHNETRFWYIRWLFGLAHNEEIDNPHENDPDIILPVPVITLLAIFITLIVATIGILFVGGKNEVYELGLCIHKNHSVLNRWATGKALPENGWVNLQECCCVDYINSDNRHLSYGFIKSLSRRFEFYGGTRQYCPHPLSDEYGKMCPHGSGVWKQKYTDGTMELKFINACETFRACGSQKRGKCENRGRSWRCECNEGYVYNPVNLKCDKISKVKEFG